MVRFSQAESRFVPLDRDVKMKRHPRPGKRHPFGHRFEIIDRRGGLDFDHPGQSLIGVQDEIGKVGASGHLDRGISFVTRVGNDLELLVLGLKKADQAIVLGLLPLRSNVDGRHTTSSRLGCQPEGGR